MTRENYSMAQPEKYTETSGVLKLPAEIILEVLSLLDIADLLSIREVRYSLEFSSMHLREGLSMNLSLRS